MSRRLNTALGLGLPVLLLAGCATVGESWQRPSAANAQPDWSLALPAGEAPADFWAAWNDPHMPDLIRAALGKNRDLRAAAARIAEARALAGVAAAADRPRVDAQAAVTRDRQSEEGRYSLAGVPNPVTQWQAGFDARWEIDLYGRLARAREAAAADLEAVRLAREALAVSLAAEVADTYFALRAAQARSATLERRIDAARDTVRLARGRVKAGLSPELDLRRAEDMLAQTEARLPPARAEAGLALRRLGVLCGGRAGDLVEALAAPAALPGGWPEVPRLLPADLLDRRPDLRAAEARVEAATARIGVAQGGEKPRLSLAANLGTLAIGGGGLLQASSLFLNAGPALSLPLYNAGALAAETEAARARRETAVAEWEQAAAAAVAEVENAALGLAEARDRHAALDRALSAQAEALRLARLRYERGLTDFSVPLDAARQRFATETEAIDARAQQLRRQVALYKALGGGWRPSGKPRS
jgi:multidrug efflux system outer membrane protein